MRKAFCLQLLFLSLFVLYGCSKKKDQDQSAQLNPPNPSTGIREPDFTWGKEMGTLVTFYYQPTDSAQGYAVPLKNKLEEVYNNIAYMLGFPNPEPIEFYCYKDPQALQRYTDHENPFLIGNKCYYGYGPPFGQPLAEFVISKLPGGESQFAFIKEGVPVLFDYSGRNYHHATNNFLKDGMLTPVHTLADNQGYAALTGGQKVIEAASLCAFIMYQDGYEKFMQVYHFKGDFETALKQATGSDIATLQKDWEAFLPEHTMEKEEEREKDATGGTP